MIKFTDKKVILSILVVIIAIAGFAFFYFDKSPDPSKPPVTWTEVPKNIQVPEKGETNLADNVAPPKNVVSLEREESPSSAVRFFEVKVENDKFIPGTIIIYQGDRPSIRMTAIDKDYDFTQPDYGLSGKLIKGEMKKIGFEAGLAGDFLFYCASCGGPSKGPVGHLIIKPLEE